MDLAELRRSHRTSKLWQWIGTPDPSDDGAWTSFWRDTRRNDGSDAWTDDRRQDAIDTWYEMNFIHEHWVSIGTGESTCLAFDAATRRCTVHGDRPRTCRSYPWYGRRPDARAGYRELISNRCSYWADVPEAQRPAPVKVFLRGGRSKFRWA